MLDFNEQFNEQVKEIDLLGDLFSEFEDLMSKRDSIKKEADQALLESDVLLKELDKNPSLENARKCRECAEKLRKMRIESQPIYDRLDKLVDSINAYINK